jgi:hypothetical protein
MTSLATEPDRHPDGPALVLSVVPDLEEAETTTEGADTDVSASALSADLPAIAAELLATIERTDKAVAELAALKETVRTWYVKFTKDAWATANVAGLCATWERYCESVGVPPRPDHASSPARNVRGTVRVPITARVLRSATGLAEAQVEVMIAALPEDQRFTSSQQSWNVTAASAVLDDPLWDPLAKGGGHRCICPTARADFQRRAVSNYGTGTLVDVDTLVIDCPASKHEPVEVSRG